MLLNPDAVSNYIDVSVAISESIPLWPGSSPIKIQKTLDIEQGDTATDTTVSFSVHTGTHIDAPSHFVLNGKSVDQMPLETMLGEVYVAAIPESNTVITASILDHLQLPPRTERLLFKTRNSRWWQQSNCIFNPDFVALTPDAAQWIVDQGIRLVGIDYLSIQRFHDGPETHQILLGAEVLIIEGLNLSKVSTGIHDIICLPMKIEGVEGAPARVLLRPKH